MLHNYTHPLTCKVPELEKKNNNSLMNKNQNMLISQLIWEQNHEQEVSL